MLPGNIREVSGHAVLRNRLPVFTSHSENQYYFHAHDAELQGTGVFRAASVSASLDAAPTLHTRDIPDLTSIPTSLTDTGVALWTTSGISVRDGYIFCHKANGDIVRRNIATGLESVYLNKLSDVGIAAVSSTEIYVMYPLSDSTYAIGLHNGTDWTSTFDGAVYGEDLVASTLDAERINGVDYILWQNDSKTNARVIKRVGQVWSDSELVFPLDVVDDTFQFRLGGASVIDNRLVICGTLIRDDTLMKIYTIGPEHFTLGREMFIAKGKVNDRVMGGIEVPLPPGKMLLVGDMLYVFGGDGRCHQALSTILFGSDREDQKATIDVLSVRQDAEANRPSRVVVEVPSTVTTPLLKSGSVLDWYATVNNVSARMGRYMIDMVADAEDGMGNTKTVVARSLASRNLSTWSSDASFDFWSQTKQTIPATSIAEMIRGTGRWEEDGEILRLADFNRGGLLYTIERSTRNGTATGEFKVSSETSYAAKYGVAIAYHRETTQDAIARLGSEAVDSSDDTVSHGLFFIVNTSDGLGRLYRVIDNEWTQVAVASTPVSTANWHWLRIDFREGRVRCYYRTGTDWIMLINHRFISDVGNPHPWFSDEIGKAAIYMENVTPHAESYGFGSLDEVIPVTDNSIFPSTGIVQVDQEYIAYDSKSPNRSLGTVSSPLSWADGKTFLNEERYRTAPPHKNLNPFPVVNLISVGNTRGSWTYPHSRQMTGGSFVATDDWKLTSVELYVSKVGLSDGYIEVWIGNDDADNAYWPPAHSILAKVKRLFKNGGNEYFQAGAGYLRGGEGWVKINLNAQLKAGEAYFVLVNNKDGKIINTSNYFSVGESLSAYRSRHLYRHYVPHVVDGTHQYSYWKTINGRSMMLKVNGRSKALPGYEIYLDGVGVSRPVEYYNGCALVCVAGRGKGRCMKITGYDHYAPHQWVSTDPSSGWESSVGDPDRGKWEDKLLRRVFVNKDPRGAFGEDSKFIIVPALNIAARDIVPSTYQSGDEPGLTPAAHLDSICSLYRPYEAEVRTFEYYSACKDLTLGGMLTEVARKANSLDVTEEKRFYGAVIGANTFDFTDALLKAVEGETAMVNFTVSSWLNGGVGLAVFSPGDGPAKNAASVAVVVYENNIKFYRYENGIVTLAQFFPLPHAVEGAFTISFQKDSFAVWNNGQYLTHFDWPESKAEEPTFYQGFSLGVINDGSIAYDVDWSAMDNHVDNFILDINQSGMALAGGLIGEKRVFFQDDQNGDLRIFRNRQTINPTIPVNLQVSQARSSMDTDLRTRIRAEGIEVVETLDYKALAEHGNLFSLVGLREPNNIAETMREVKRIMADLLRSQYPVDMNGAVDPRVEPEDILLVTLAEGEHKLILINTVSMTLKNSDKRPVFDMTASGEIWGNGSAYAPDYESDDETIFVTGKEQKFTIATDASPTASIALA